MRRPTCVIYDRLSRADDLSTSIDTQTSACRAYAESQGWRVLFVSDEDNGVSGASKLADRPGMRRVLAALDTADYLIAAKLDRFARSMIEFATLTELCRESATTLVTADGMISATTSGFLTKLMALLAEWERDTIAARILASKETLRRTGRWNGGAAPYGYQIIKRDGGTYLDIDELSAVVLRGVVEDLRGGATITSITRGLNWAGVPSPQDYRRIQRGMPPKGTLWSATALKDILLSPAMRGHLVQSVPGGKRRRGAVVAVLDDAGSPQQVGPELLNAADHGEICGIFAERATAHRATGRRQTKTMLHGAAKCGQCASALYANARKGRATTLFCATCARAGRRNVTIVMHAVETAVENALLGRFGRMAMEREITTPAADLSREIRECEGALDALVDSLPALPRGGRAAQRAAGQITALEAKLEVLEARQAEAAVPKRRFELTGRTLAEEWAVRGADGRRAVGAIRRGGHGASGTGRGAYQRTGGAGRLPRRCGGGSASRGAVRSGIA